MEGKSKDSEKNFYALSREALFGILATGEGGLGDDEASRRLKRYGPNKLSEKKKVSPLTIFINQFKNILIIILLVAAAFTFFVYAFGEHDRSDLIEGSLILAIVVMIAVLGFFQEYRAEKAIEALKKLLAFRAKVIRGGKQKEIDTIYLVPGDLVILEEGGKVPADIRLVDVANLRTSEASLTGESTPITKKTDALLGELAIADQKNMVFSGTAVASGRGKGIVVATGDKTQIGQIARFVAETEEGQTPIQKRLDRLGKILGLGTLAISSIVFAVIVFFAEDLAHLTLFERILKAFIASVALAVAAIPEGLPAVVTISLAFGTQRMLKRNALVRKLNSMETLGSVDVICADKTGTLTTAEMTVREIYFDGGNYEVSGEGYKGEGAFLRAGNAVNPESFQLLLEIGLVCNNANFDDEGRLLGDPTEGALLVSAKKANISSQAVRLYEEPFSSERKMMSVAAEERGAKRIYTKGAPEVVLSHCAKVIRNGSVVSLSSEDREAILKENARMAEKALRVLGFAYKDVNSIDEKSLENDLVFAGMQGMMDPPRKEIFNLISQCKTSGIRVVMITGDHLATAQAIAHEIGLEGAALTGADVDHASQAEFEERVEHISVYARVSPGHKFRIVEALKKHGHLVAMTGDGVNDAPALKRADIGIAMGITGTDVAKEASDMVLLDDRFNTIVAAIEEGRGIFDNIRKFVDYLLSCNIGEVLVVFLALLLFRDVPLTAVMLLWINVVTDGLPAVALGLDPAEKGILRYSPLRFQEQILNKRVWAEILVFGVAMTIATLWLFFRNLSEGLEEARAAAFMAIVIFELVRLVNIRSAFRISWRANIWLPLAIVSSVALQLVLVYVPIFADWFELSPIDVADWLYIGGAAFVLFVIFWFFDKILDRFMRPIVRSQKRLA